MKMAAGNEYHTKSSAQERLRWTREMLRQPRRSAPDGLMPGPRRPASNLARSDYTEAVRAVKSYIIAGACLPG